MPDYEKLYHTLFNDITDVIILLQKAQLAAEETVCDEPPLPLDFRSNADKQA